MISLSVFMDRAARRPFEYGVFDCNLFLADWVLNVRGVDPAAHLRGRYHGPWGYRRIMVLHGGPVGVVASCAKRAGLERTRDPRANDIGLIYGLIGEGARPGLVGAICAGKRWIALSPSGVVGAIARPAIAWRV